MSGGLRARRALMSEPMKPMKTHRRITLLVLMAVAAAGPSARAAETLAGWHEFSTAYQDYGAASSSKVADEYLGGISASLYGGNGARDQ